MRVAVHQPQYLPWLGYLDKLDSADVFVVLDTVQFKKHEWQNRNRIRTNRGWQWLTVPIVDRFPERIDRVAIDARAAWSRKHGQALRLHYAKAPFWEPVGPALLALLDKPWTRIRDLSVAVLEMLCARLSVGTRLVLASSLAARDEPTDRLIDLCRAVGGTEYLSGSSGPAYMRLDRFAEAGIAVSVQDYRHPEYSQRYTPFVSHLSVVDLLLNCGPDSLAVLRTGRRWVPLVS
jgi:hypothetical protein